MSELKPCPFCGGEARLTSFDDGPVKRWFIQCKKHIECGGRMIAKPTETEAIVAWNRRASDNKDAEIERLKENIKALENDNYNAEMNLEHVTAELAESRRREKEAVEDILDAAVLAMAWHSG